MVEAVGEGDGDLVADVGPDRRPGNGVAVGEGAHVYPAEVDVGGLRGQGGVDGAAGVGPCRLGRRDGILVDRMRAGGG
ncbi:hypothetical protein [Rhodococcus opacus]|uniref:hypothetical protein n=1 Tax=Rhodococcus opacus TaxID=37919 RepID=UPI0026D08CBB